MFACPAVVNKATVNDDLPPPGSALAEALQLARQDPANVGRLVKAAAAKLSSPHVLVRVKAIRLLSHLAQNGPPSALIEVRLYSQAISDCFGFRGPAHPTRGFEPYQDLKDAAQALLDLTYQTQQRAPVGIPVTAINQPQPTQIGTGYQYGSQQAFGSETMYNPGQTYSNSPYPAAGNTFGNVSNTPPSRTTKDQIADGFKQVGNFFKKTLNRGNQFQDFDSQQQMSQMPGTSSTGMTTSYNSTGYIPPPSQAAYVPPTEPSKTSLDSENPYAGEFNHSGRSFKKQIKKQTGPVTPAQKIMKVTSGRALATENEVLQFKQKCTPESIQELIDGMDNSDWKVKVRAIQGLEAISEVYDLASIARCKSKLAAYTTAPQASLRTISNRVYEKVKDVAPRAEGEAPSAFSFDMATPVATPDDVDAGFSFEAADDSNITPVENQGEDGFNFGDAEVAITEENIAVDENTGFNFGDAEIPADIPQELPAEDEQQTHEEEQQAAEESHVDEEQKEENKEEEQANEEQTEQAAEESAE